MVLALCSYLQFHLPFSLGCIALSALMIAVQLNNAFEFKRFECTGGFKLSFEEEQPAARARISNPIIDDSAQREL